MHSLEVPNAVKLDYVIGKGYAYLMLVWYDNAGNWVHEYMKEFDTRELLEDAMTALQMLIPLPYTEVMQN